jgi:hypothetical protein
MKIAAIALASALASMALAQPSFAQQTGNQDDQNQYGRMQYGPGMQDRYHGSQNRSDDTYGQGEWRQNQNWRNAENEGWRRDREGMRGHMGMMGMMGRMHERFGDRGASFSFGNGNARMSVHCPSNESVETCVRAATQLLDKIGSLKSGTSGSTGTTNGANINRDMDDSSHSQLNRSPSGSSSGQPNGQ